MTNLDQTGPFHHHSAMKKMDGQHNDDALAKEIVHRVHHHLYISKHDQMDYHSLSNDGQKSQYHSIVPDADMHYI